MTDQVQNVVFLSNRGEAPRIPGASTVVRRIAKLGACLAMPESLRPDLILLGLSLDDALPDHAVRRLGEAMPDVPLVVCADQADEALALTLIDVGATDYVLCDLMDDEVLASRLDYAVERHVARALFREAFRVKGCKPARRWDWAFELDARLRFCWLSQSFEAKQRLRPDKLLGVTPWEVDEVDHDPERWRQYVKDMEAGKPFASLTCQTRGGSNKIAAMRLWGDPVFSPAGAFLGYSGVGVDISQEVENALRLTDAYSLLKDMFDDLQGYRERLEGDLEAARDSQRALIPKDEALAAIEKDAGVRITYYFEPTSELGGDIWGALPLEDGGFALYLADFSGHGVAAALNTFRLTTLIQEHREERGRPAAYLEFLNERLKEQLPTGQYATILYGVVEPKAGVFRYAAAAAQRPLVVDLRTGDIVVGEGRGLPLGAVSGAKFQERELPIGPGKMILLSSDALSETVDGDGRSLGKEGVVELLRRTALEKGVEANAWTLLGLFFQFASRPLKDDLTLLTCRIGPV